MIKSIAFTCYPVMDMDRARSFYEGILGLKPAKNFDGHFQEYELGDGVFTLGLVSGEGMPDFFKSRAVSVAFEVDDMDAATAKIKEHGIPIILGPHDAPTCRSLFITDPDNNVVALHQLKNDLNLVPQIPIFRRY